jgi:hypothetical protein
MFLQNPYLALNSDPMLPTSVLAGMILSDLEIVSRIQVLLFHC